ncbi:MAG TPA: hypothetical protein VGR16_14400 [Thermomicrobiales bacterium]|nr:hypothetical protein [Thermomicrobiales bacterium]
MEPQQLSGRGREPAGAEIGRRADEDHHWGDAADGFQQVVKRQIGTEIDDAIPPSGLGRDW